jgi:hypothetical protein
MNQNMFANNITPTATTDADMITFSDPQNIIMSHINYYSVILNNANSIKVIYDSCQHPAYHVLCSGVKNSKKINR